MILRSFARDMRQGFSILSRVLRLRKGRVMGLGPKR